MSKPRLHITDSVTQTVHSVETKAQSVAHSTEKMIRSYRKSAAKRHPTLFLIATTFGVVATFLGFEKIIDEINFFNNNPYVILIAGLGVLVLTGTLYKKLG